MELTSEVRRKDKLMTGKIRRGAFVELLEEFSIK